MIAQRRLLGAAAFVAMLGKLFDKMEHPVAVAADQNVGAGHFRLCFCDLRQTKNVSVAVLVIAQNCISIAHSLLMMSWCLPTSDGSTSLPITTATQQRSDLGSAIVIGHQSALVLQVDNAEERAKRSYAHQSTNQHTHELASTKYVHG